jgi:hypothetical protein
MCGDLAEPTAMLRGRLAATHDAGRAILLDVIEQGLIANVERVVLR